MTVFSLFSAEHAATEIDLFVEPPSILSRRISWLRGWKSRQV